MPFFETRSFPHQDISSKTVSCVCAWLLVLGSIGSACDSKSTPDDEARSVEAAPVERSPAFHLAMAGAQHWMARAKQQSFDKAMMRARNQIARQERESRPRPPNELLEQGNHLTLLFSANNHGEREDCGCKRNPLGGLTRRATLIELVAQATPKQNGADSPEQELQHLYKYWEIERGEEVVLHEAPIFIADAGDLLFAHTTIKSAPKSSQDASFEQAEAVIAGLNLSPPDVVNVGENDLALGLDALKKLTASARFPFVSANLRGMDGSAPFDDHLLVERGEQKIAYIGIIKPRARHKDYYLQQGVKVEEPLEAYVRAANKLPEDVDLVVLLSNEGVPATEKLIPAIKARGARVDVAIASGSNMLTKQARWVDGVPLVEPMSQGKHFGRLDVVLRGEAHDPPDFMNESANRLELLDEYRRAWLAYLNASYSLRRQQEQLARYELQASDGLVPEQAGRLSTLPGSRRKMDGESQQKEKKDAPPSPEQLAKNRETAKSAIARERERLVQLGARLELTSKEALRLAAKLEESSSGQAGSGDDWFEMRIVPVLLEIPEQSATRKALDKFK